MQNIFSIKLILSLILFNSFFTFGQSPLPEKKESIKLYVDCRCDKNYVRQEIKHVNHVRDQDLANVQLFIFDIANGSGGRTYKLEFTGKSSFEGITKTLTLDSNPNMTAHDVRKRLAWKIGRGLLGYIIKSDLENRVVYKIKGKPKNTSVIVEDPWKNWIFEIYGQAKFDKETSRTKFEYKVGLESDRVTDKWRIRADVQMSQLKNKILRNDEVIHSGRERYWGAASVVKSVSDHWSTGVFGNLRHDTYTNIDVSIGFSPAIEYNIFPYSEVLKREITFAYKIGYNYNNYAETTIFNKDVESIWNHSFNLHVKYRQTWGNISSSIRASSFLNDFSKNRINVSGSTSLRVLKGLSVRFAANMQFIRDQINLPAGTASLEDVLLQQKQIATDYDLGFSVGVSYTFGSAFNNIINTRL
jgi:hypothetical protein